MGSEHADLAVAEPGQDFAFGSADCRLDRLPVKEQAFGLDDVKTGRPKRQQRPPSEISSDQNWLNCSRRVDSIASPGPLRRSLDVELCGTSWSTG